MFTMQHFTEEYLVGNVKQSKNCQLCMRQLCALLNHKVFRWQPDKGYGNWTRILSSPPHYLCFPAMDICAIISPCDDQQLHLTSICM